MKIGICDDNEIHGNYLNEIVKKFFIDSEAVEITLLTPQDLFYQIETNHFLFDLLITDIELGNFNGIRLAERAKEKNASCQIIFVSNFLNFATQVYDVPHLYFVLKSEAKERLPKALELMTLEKKEDALEKKYILLKYQNTVTQVLIREIIYLEAFGRYLYVHEAHQVNKYIHTMKSAQDQLPDYFIKTHKSYLVNLHFISSTSRTSCLMKNHAEIPISRNYAKPFHEKYLEYVSNSLE